MNLSDNLITAVAALGGSLIGGIMSLLGTKLAADKEYRLKREDIIRKAAEERIKMLYEPLLNLMSPGPPYDDFCFDPELCGRIINIIEKNEKYASPDLLNIFWKFRFSLYNNFEEISKGHDVAIYDIVFSEYEKLKDVLGFGRILRKPLKLNLIIDKMRSYIKLRLKKW